MIEKEIQNIEVVIEKSKKELAYTLALKQQDTIQYCYSKYYPKRDAIKRVEEDIGNKETLWICFGFGMGYTLEYLYEKVGEDTNIIIIEPDEEVLTRQLVLNRKLNINKNTSIYTGIEFEKLKDILKNNINIENKYNINIITVPLYLNYYYHYYTQVVEIISEIKKNVIIQHNTIREFAEKHLKNIIKNAKYIEESFDVRQYYDKYKDIPAVIVSAGPSLEKNIDDLKEFKGIIFSGGRSIGAVLDQGRQPHFICSIDPQDIAYDILDQRLQQLELPLVTCPAGNHKVVENHKGKKYFLNLGEKGVEGLVETELERVTVGGSVATLCISLAHYMGCNPIVLIGQDLAYTNLKTHADNCLGKEIDLKSDSKYIKVKGYYGNEEYSDSVLITYLRWIEDFAKYQSATHFINATEGGAFIKNMENKPFKEVVKKYNDKVIPNIEDKKLQSSDKQSGMQKINERLQGLSDELEEICLIAKEGQKLSAKLQKIFVGNNSFEAENIQVEILEINKELEIIDEKILASGSAYEIGVEMFTAIYEEIETALEYKELIGETPQEEGVRVSRKSYELYRRLAWSINETKKYIKGESI